MNLSFPQWRNRKLIYIKKLLTYSLDPFIYIASYRTLTAANISHAARVQTQSVFHFTLKVLSRTIAVRLPGHGNIGAFAF